MPPERNTLDGGINFVQGILEPAAKTPQIDRLQYTKGSMGKQESLTSALASPEQH